MPNRRRIAVLLAIIAAVLLMPATASAATEFKPSVLSFGDVKLGQTSETLSADLFAEDSFTQIEYLVSGQGGQDFPFSFGCSAYSMVVTRANCPLSARFTPSETGPRNLAFSILAYTPSGVAQFTIEMTGNGIDPGGRLTPATHDFGSLELGSRATKEFTLASTGTTPLKIKSMQVTGDGFSLTGDTCGSQIKPGTSCQLTARFEPSGSAGVRTGQLSVASNDRRFESSLSGTATSIPPAEPKLGLKLASTNKVKPGKKLVATATVTNRGTGAITGIVIDSAVTAKLANKPPKIKIASLAPGASMEKTIRIAVKKKAKAGKKLKVTVTASAGGKKLHSAKRTIKIKK